MSFYDSLTGNYSDVATALDTHSLAADNTSIFDSAANIVTKGVPLTALSIINSFANTGVKVANFFGADITPFDTESQARDIFGEDTADYYKEHSGAIELAGLAIGSFIPGMAALKALKLAQATGETGALLGRALGVFSGARTKAIAEATKQIELGPGALFPTLNAEKYKAIAAGFGEQALQSLVWETASLATQNASPIFDNMDLTDTLWNVGVGTIFGGAIGGGIEAIGAARIFRADRVKQVLESNIQEGIRRYGGLDSMVGGGDRVAAIAESIDKIGAFNTANPELGGKILAKNRRAAAEQSAILDAKKFLQTLGPKDDQEVANNLVDSLIDFKKRGLANGEDTYNLLLRLGKISRLSLDEAENSTGSLPTGEQFYINRFGKKSLASANFEDLISSNPHPDAIAQRFQMKLAGDRPQIATFSDHLTLADGSTVPQYHSPQEAFTSGADIFIDNKFNIHINTGEASRVEQIAQRGENLPLSQRAEAKFQTKGSVPEGTPAPTGAPIIYNNFTGALLSSASPVVGDIGRASLLQGGMQVGDRFLPQTLEGINTAATPTFEAHARFVWAGLRGIKPGDVIDVRDLPFLEQLYREAAQSPEGDLSRFASLKERQGITLKNGETGEEFAIPRSQGEYEGMLKGEKNRQIGELLQSNPELTAEEISRRINVPETYLSAGLKSETYSGATIPLAQLQAVNHVKLEYNLNNYYRDNQGMVIRGMQDLQYRIKVIQDAADTALARYSASPETFEALKIRNVESKDVGPEGAGAGFLSAANAGYNTIAQKFERVGRVVAAVVLGKNKAIADTLFSPIQALRNDPLAMQELNYFNFIRRTTAHTYEFLPAEIAKEAGVSADTAVLSRAVTRNARGEITGWDKNYTPKDFMPANALQDTAGQVDHSALHTFYELSPKVAAFERANLLINDGRVVSRNNWYVAMGMQPKLQTGVLYAPPIDTAKYPYFAMVKQRQGMAFGDNSVSVITAKSSAELQQKIVSLQDEFEVYTKDQIKKYHEVLGDYDYDRNFSQNVVNSELKRRGILNDLVPDVGSEGFVRDIIDFHSRQETRLARDYVELGNAQLFAEVRSLGERFTGTETSKTGFTPAIFGRTAANPYNDLVKTALAISPKENYRLWADANDKLEAFASSAFQAAKNGFNLAKQGILPFEEANNLANKMGLGNIYSNMTDSLKAYQDIAYKLPPQRYLSKFVSTANSVMAATAIRLDFFQSLINVVSTPVLALAEAHSAQRSIQEMMTTQLPGVAGVRIPSATKLMYQAVASFASNDELKQTLNPLFKEIQVLKSDHAEYYRLLDNMTLPFGKLSDSQWTDRIQNMVELGSKYTGSNLSEDLSRYVPGYMAYRIFTAAGQAGQELKDNISTFVNRVQGNYIAAQRPVAFQGPLGQAIGLFQTYQINLLQQMLRYVQNGEAKSLAILAGAQSTLFGINGLPGFQAINQHIIGTAAGNPSHADAFSTLTSPGIASENPLQKDVGDYLLYGVLSNFLHTGLYSRGDINPRNVTVLPINPLDYPAISGGIKLLSSLVQVGRQIAQGGSIPTSLLLGLEHNGLSRPLAGLAQLAQGYVTTGQGGIIATSRPNMGDNSAGFSELATVANFSRLLGARPLDEAVVLDSTYRRTLYQAADRTRIEHLGEAFKSNIYGEEPNSDLVNGFTAKYTAAGGNIANYGKTILSWTQNANASVANQIYKQLSTPANQNMIRSMGGVKLPDFRSYNPEIPASTTATSEP